MQALGPRLLWVALLTASACSSKPPKPAPPPDNVLAPDTSAGLPPADPTPPAPEKPPAPPEPEPPREPAADPGKQALDSVQSAPVPAGFSISLERSACFGTCPVYVVTVRANGSVSFAGESPSKGCVTKTVPASDVGKLAALVKQSDFFRLKPQYRAMVTDHPWAHVEVRAAGRTKKVSHYLADDFAKDDLDVRANLRALEAAIDTVTGARELAKSASGPCK